MVEQVEKKLYNLVGTYTSTPCDALPLSMILQLWLAEGREIKRQDPMGPCGSGGLYVYPFSLP